MATATVKIELGNEYLFRYNGKERQAKAIEWHGQAIRCEQNNGEFRCFTPEKIENLQKIG